MFMSVEENMNLMKTLDDAWNSQDWDTFSKRHADDVIVRWPGQPPTMGIEAHKKEGEYFFKAFPDNHVGNNPYKIFFTQGDWTCSVAEFTGTHKGTMMAIRKDVTHNMLVNHIANCTPSDKVRMSNYYHWFKRARYWV